MDPYVQAQKSHFHGFCKVFNLSTAATTQDLVTVSTEQSLQHTIRIQRLKVVIVTGSAGKTFTLRDKAASPIILSPAIDMTTTGATFSYDFGPKGVTATINKSVELLISAAGAAAIVEIEGYQVRSATAS